MTKLWNVFGDHQRELPHVRFNGYDMATNEPPKPTPRGLRLTLPVIEAQRGKLVTVCGRAYDPVCLVLSRGARGSLADSKYEYIRRGVRLVAASKSNDVCQRQLELSLRTSGRPYYG